MLDDEDAASSACCPPGLVDLKFSMLIVSKMSSETSEAYKTHSRVQVSRGSDLYHDDTDNT
jgi:hypothetical protein